MPPPITWCAITSRFMAEIVRDHDGAVVKTIGDAVMAAFAQPADAVRAALAIQRDIAAGIAQATSAAAPIVIKLGVHQGPSIAVTLERPARLFRLDRQHGGAAAGAERRRRHRALAGDDRRPGRRRRRWPACSPFARPRDLKGFSEPLTFYRLQSV